MSEPSPPAPDNVKSGSIQAAEAAGAAAVQATGAAVTHGAQSFVSHNTWLFIGIAVAAVAVACYFIF